MRTTTALAMEKDKDDERRCIFHCLHACTYSRILNGTVNGSNNMSVQEIGTRIGKARQKLGLSMYALSQASGVHQSLILRIESGEVAKPTPETLAKLAHALGLSVSQLYRSAGYATDPLPDFKGYLRTKYGHLPAEKRAELSQFFEEIQAEFGKEKVRRADEKAKRSAKGGRS